MQHKISKNFLTLAYFTVIFIISSLLLLLWFCKRKELCPSPQKPLSAVRWGLGSPQAPSCTHQPCRTELKHCIYGVTLPGACAQVQDKNGATGTDTPPHWKEQAAGHVSHTTVVWKEHEVGPVERKGTQLDTLHRDDAIAHRQGSLGEPAEQRGGWGEGDWGAEGAGRTGPRRGWRRCAGGRRGTVTCAQEGAAAPRTPSATASPSGRRHLGVGGAEGWLRACAVPYACAVGLQRCVGRGWAAPVPRCRVWWSCGCWVLLRWKGPSSAVGGVFLCFPFFFCLMRKKIKTI